MTKGITREEAAKHVHPLEASTDLYVTWQSVDGHERNLRRVEDLSVKFIRKCLMGEYGAEFFFIVEDE